MYNMCSICISFDPNGLQVVTNSQSKADRLWSYVFVYDWRLSEAMHWHPWQ